MDHDQAVTSHVSAPTAALTPVLSILQKEFGIRWEFSKQLPQTFLHKGGQKLGNSGGKGKEPKSTKNSLKGTQIFEKGYLLSPRSQ